VTMPPPARARVLLVDDHPIVRRGLRALVDVEPDLEVCSEVDDAPSALRAIDVSKPDVAIVDISLQKGDGLELVRQIRARWPLPVLVLSIHDEGLYGERALRAGASGYVMKQEATGAVVNALRHVLKGDLWLSERLSARLLRAYVQGEPGLPADSPLSILSDRELQVFQLISDGCPTSEISRWLNISRKTVETHRAHIKEKMELRTGLELIQYAARYKDAFKAGD
jgi:DNA-binding NarL/FixJ family response regulator